MQPPNCKQGRGNYAHDSLHYSIQNFLQEACIMLENLCIILKIIPNKLKQKCKIDYLFEILADL